MHGSRLARIVDPLQFGRLLWPDVKFTRDQKDIIYSVRDNDQTFVPAGNMLGKDFVAAFIVLWFFLTREPCKIIVTSVDSTQLEGVLWGEIRTFIQASKYPLESTRGGPLVVNHMHLRKVFNKVMTKSYVKARVCAKGEGMLGHHAYPPNWDGITPHTLFIADEASGVDNESWNNALTWAHRMLAIGNCYPCENFFREGIKAGDLLAA